MVPTKREDGSNFPLSAEFRQNAARKQHWGTYAAAAGAAFAMSTNASADIVYSGETVTASVTPGGDGISVRPFTVAGFNEVLAVFDHVGASSKSGVAVVLDTNTASPPGLQFFRAQSTGDFVGKNYHLGQLVNGADTSHGSTAVFRQHSTGSGRTFNDAGRWGPGTVTSFLGFKVKGGSLAGDLGWLKVKVSDAGSPGYPNEAEVLGWAYDTTGAAIPTPEPAGVALGLLAIGAAGILAFRKRRKELAACRL